MKKIIRIYSVLVMGVLCGCTTVGRVETGRTRYEAPPVIVPQSVIRPVSTDGSLWSGNASTWSLIADARASQPGDVITINIIDQSEGETGTESSTDRKANIVAGIENFFGKEAKYGGGRRADGNDVDIQLNKLLKADSTLSFESEGETKQDHKLIAEISAIVTGIHPNGNLKIHGYKVTGVGREQNMISVEGIVRPEDINFENTVDSTKIANAVISYEVRGPNSGDMQSPGWMMRVFNKYWPF